LFNVLRGDMSMVGPRPKLAQHEKMLMACRPGITGAATIMFCDEERMLAHVPDSLVEQHALAVFNPIKVKLDEEYQRKASFATDVRILMRTVLRAGRGSMVVELVPRHIGRFSEQVQSQGDAQDFARFPASGPLSDSVVGRVR
jgi:lipopolysaccharide/colanic/teichoic acid biosynthesis glycosyltransferase